MPVSGLNHGSVASRNPPLQNMAFRAVQVVSKTREVAEQQLFAKSYETELSDDSFLDLEHVRAFFEVAAACVAFGVVGFHVFRKLGDFKSVELIFAWCDTALANSVGNSWENSTSTSVAYQYR